MGSLFSFYRSSLSLWNCPVEILRILSSGADVSFLSSAAHQKSQCMFVLALVPNETERQNHDDRFAMIKCKPFTASQAPASDYSVPCLLIAEIDKHCEWNESCHAVQRAFSMQHLSRGIRKAHDSEYYCSPQHQARLLSPVPSSSIPDNNGFSLQAAKDLRSHSLVKATAYYIMIQHSNHNTNNTKCKL